MASLSMWSCVWSCVCVGMFFFSLSVSSIPVSVMLSLTQVSSDGTLVNPNKLNSDFQQLRSGGVDGVMGDVWWGIVEQQPGVYNWTAYVQIASIAQKNGLTYQPIMSFHECGGNVGDDCNYPIPAWASSVAKANDLFYKDKHNAVDLEYLSLSADSVALFPSSSSKVYRTATQIYEDFMSSFKSAMAAYIPKTVNVIQVGLGPAGEMRFPGYQSDRWTYCGVGEFQCYDSRMLANLSAAATAAGHSDWGNAGPSDAGSYNTCPFDANFWIDNGNTDNFASPYGQFFIGWYSGMLLSHGRNVLSQAQQVFKGSGLEISAKVAGVHWWYSEHSHGAEVTSGYYNTNQQNAYLNIAKMFADCGANFDFTALELIDGTQKGQCDSYKNNQCGSLPEELVGQTIQAAQSARVNYEGENALTICPETSGTCNQAAFNQVLYQSTRYYPIHRFTFLRISDNLLYNSVNWNMFMSFVAQMKAAG